MADTFWAETDGRDETYGIDDSTGYDETADGSIFFNEWMNFEGLHSGLADAETVHFTAGNKIYFLTGNEYIYYDGITSGNVKDIAYVPIVALGKKPDGTEGTPNENFNHLSDFWKESFSADGVALEYVLGKQYLADGITPITLSTNLFKAYLHGVEKVENTDFTFNRTTWKATFTVAPTLGTDNLVIQLEADALMDETIITKCTMAIKYGSKVMISGHPSYSHRVRFCATDDPTYWPENSDFGVGNSALAVNGFGKMGDYLVTYKQPGDETSQYYSEIDIDSAGVVSYPTKGLNEEYGCIAKRTVKAAQNGLLALSDKGVVWTWPRLVQGQANCKVVSRNVNGRNGIASGILDNTKADLALAHAEIYMNKYLLFIKDKVWVLDLDYSDLANDIACWYPYTGIFANAGFFLVKDDRLYMGDKTDGILYRSQLAEDDYRYNDNGAAIDAWWTSPLMFLGGRDWEKKFERINMTFKPTFGTDHILSLISDLGVEDITLLQSAGFFDARYFHAQYLNAGTDNEAYPTTQSEKIGYKGQYLQFRIRNSMLDRSLTMLSALISYSLRKTVK